MDLRLNKKKRNTKVNQRQISYKKESATKNRRSSSQIVAELQLPIGKRSVQHGKNSQKT